MVIKTSTDDYEKDDGVSDEGIVHQEKIKIVGTKLV